MAEPTISTDIERKKYLLERFASKEITLDEFVELACWPRTKITDDVRSLKGKKKQSDEAVAKGIRDKFVKAGFKGSTPWSEIASNKGVAQLINADSTTMSDITNFQTFEYGAQSFYNNNKSDPDLFDSPLPDSSPAKITGKGGIARSPDLQTSLSKAAAAKAFQYRRTSKPMYVPESSLTFKAIFDTLAQVDDKETRTALVLNLFVPYRPGEINSLKVSDINLALGRIEKDTTNPNKIRQGLQIPDVVRAMLVSLIDEKGPDDELFPNVTTEKMTRALNQAGIQEAFKPYATLMGRPKDKPIKGVSDFRKLIPSLLAYELGGDASVISVIMGHDDVGSLLKAVTSKHYVSPIAVARGGDADDYKALVLLQNMIATHLEAKTLNQLPEILRIDAMPLTAKGARQLIVPDSIGEGHLTPAPRELTEAERAEIDSRSIRAAAENREATADATLRAIAKEEELLVKQEALDEKRRVREEQRKTPEGVRAGLESDLNRQEVSELKKSEATSQIAALEEKRLLQDGLDEADQSLLDRLRKYVSKPPPKFKPVPLEANNMIMDMIMDAKEILSDEDMLDLEEGESKRYAPENLSSDGLHKAMQGKSEKAQQLKRNYEAFKERYDSMAEGDPNARKADDLIEHSYHVHRQSTLNGINDIERSNKITQKLFDTFKVRAGQVAENIFNRETMAGIGAFLTTAADVGATLVGPGKVIKGAEFAADIGAEVVMPSPMGTELENNPEDLSEDTLFAMLQSNFTTEAGKADTDRMIRQELDRRVSEREEVAAIPSQQILPKRAREYLARVKPQIEQAFISRDLTDVTAPPEPRRMPTYTERQLYPQKYKNIEDDITDVTSIPDVFDPREKAREIRRSNITPSFLNTTVN